MRQTLFMAWCLSGCVLAKSGNSTHVSTTAAAAGGAASGGGAQSGGSTSGIAAPSPIGKGPPGGPGCGFDSAAFCETFDAPATTQGRAGELDATLWSASRGEPQLPTGLGAIFGVGAATIPNCRAGLLAQVFPSMDALICDANAAIASTHLLVAVGAQNYGQNSYRVRQPFDFTDRTGTIHFDAEAEIINPLLGWISVEITEDPTPIPGYAKGNPNQTNDEGTAAPKNALEIQLASLCHTAAGAGFAVSLVDVLTDHVDAFVVPDNPVCVDAQAGHLNHFEIKVSQAKVEVYATPDSSDGVTFAPAQLMYSGPISLPFQRGYVQFTTHNHATRKYSGLNDGVSKGFGADTYYDAWFARWDNLGFDGPVITNWREYEIADSLIPGTSSWDLSGPTMNIGYTIADVKDGPSDTLIFHAVDIGDVASAQLVTASWYNCGNGDPLDQFILRYRLNGGPWHDRPLTTDEIAMLTNGHSQGAIAQAMDVPVGELVAGDNTLEFITVDVPQNYPPAVSSIDLVLTTKGR